MYRADLEARISMIQFRYLRELTLKASPIMVSSNDLSNDPSRNKIKWRLFGRPWDGLLRLPVPDARGQEVIV